MVRNPAQTGARRRRGSPRPAVPRCAQRQWVAPSPEAGPGGRPPGAAAEEPSAPRTGATRARARRGPRGTTARPRGTRRCRACSASCSDICSQPSCCTVSTGVGGWVEVTSSLRLTDDGGSRVPRSGHCARLPDQAGAQNPFPQRRLQCFLLQQAVFFLEGCEPRPDTFYLSHPWLHGDGKLLYPLCGPFQL